MTAQIGMRIVSFRAENIKRLTAVAITPNGSIVEITGKNGAGKQQPVSEPVLTPEGWRTMGALRVGDRVIGADGKPTEVTGVFPQSERRTFLVTMADGASTRCGPDHLWTVFSWKSQGGESIRVKETLSTSELLRIGLRNGLPRKWAVPLVEPVEFDDIGEELPVAPYTLGVILGDGHIEPSGYVTVTSWDPEILDALNSEGWRTDKELGTGAWSRPLRHMGLGGKLAHEKYIPEIYQRGSINDRRDLFFGLMDTDGTVEDSWASFCSTSERLIDDLVRLGSSLGFICKKRAGATKKYRYNGELKEGRMAWTVGVKSEEPPFHLMRKSSRWSTSVLKPEPRRFIDTIIEVEQEDSVCIQVAAPDGLYVTKDFIVTHNTSVLDAIWWALRGGNTIQETPIRKGSETAFIELNLGRLKVTRKFKAKDGGHTTSLIVETEDGIKAQNPQQTLDAIYGELTFDPLAFTRKKPKDQFDTLKQFVPGVDFEAIDKANDTDFKTRTDINRRAGELRAQIAGIQVPELDGSERIDESKLISELAAAGDHNTEIEREKARRENRRQSIARLQVTSQQNRERIAQLRAQADNLELDTDAMDKNIAAELAALSDAPELPVPTDTAEVQAKINAARNTNAAIDAAARARQSIDALTAQAVEQEQKSQVLTDAMKARTKTKEEAVAAAKIPVNGITFGDGHILLGGVPFDQASDAEQLRASIEIAAAMNPRLRIIRVRDGSLLDEDSMKLLADMAEKSDMQIWVETVSSDRPGAIVLEDGHVRAAIQQAAE